MELLRLLLDVTGSRCLKMATAKPEVLISQFLDLIATKFQRLSHMGGVQQLNGTCIYAQHYKQEGMQLAYTATDAP